MGRARVSPVLIVGLLVALCACGRPDAPRAGSPGAPSAATVAPTPDLTPPLTPPRTATTAPTPSASIGQMPAPIDFHAFPLTPATYEGTALGEGGGVIVSAATSGSWTSPWREPGFAFTRLIPSWNAETPEGTWITIEAQLRRTSGGETRWYSFGTWAYLDTDVRRATVNGQKDADGDVATDTFEASAPMAAYRVRVTLLRKPGSGQTPVVRLVAAVTSDDAAVPSARASAYGGTASFDLPIPSYSQEIHAGEYPQYDGGGEAWCSPTSTAMVLAYFGRGPSAEELAWVDPRYADKHVDHAARYTYDSTYRGTGNWSFNTAYAARYGLRSFVTQLRSLAEAERFIAAGIPLVASVTVPPGGLPGFLFAQGTAGHLLVIRGFTQGGDVVVNDPAATSNAAVRRVYPRASFERVWVGRSGGIVYVIHPADRQLPDRVPGATANW